MSDPARFIADNVGSKYFEKLELRSNTAVTHCWKYHICGDHSELVSDMEKDGNTWKYREIPR